MSKVLYFLVLLFPASSFCEGATNPVDGSLLFTNATYSNLRISPNGKLVSAVFKDEKQRNISLIDIEKNEFVLEIDLGLEGSLLNYYWVNDTQLILIGRYKGITAFLIATILSDKVEVKLSETQGYLVDVLAEKPNQVLIARKKNGSSYELLVVTMQNLIDNEFDDAIEIEHDDSYVSQFFYDHYSNKIITAKYDSDSETLTIKTIPKTGGRWKTILTRKIDDIEFSVAAILDSNYLAVLTNEKTDKVALFTYNIKEQKLEDLVYQHPKYDLKGAGYNDEGELSYVSFEELGLTRVEYFNAITKKENIKLANTFQQHEYFLVDKDTSGNRSILKITGGDLPGEYLISDRKKNTLSRLLLSHPELEDRKLYKSKVFTTKTSDGADIEAFLTSPDSKNSLKTLLVMPHGGPIGVKDDDRFNPIVQYFVTRGFSILRVNFRGSDGFGKSFQEQGVGEFGKLIEKDISTVVDRVINESNYNHVCSMGASYGGYSAVMLAIKRPELYDCVVGGFGVYDLPLIFNHDNHISQEENREKWEAVVGKYSPELKKHSPVYFAERLKAPILLTAGVEDETAVFEHTYRFAYVLKMLNHPVETLYYENTGHNHAFWSGDRHEAAITYDFLIRTLGLNYPSKDELSDKARFAIAEGFSIIADKYSFEDSVKNDEAKALEFYKKAAEYGEPRSNFNLGAHYHRGELVEKDLNKAVYYYQHAAELEYASAHRRLGRMYMEGEHFEIDWGKSKHHLEKALNLDDTEKNYMALARFDCTAPKEFRNVRRCLNILNLERFNKRSKASYRKAIQSLRRVAPWIIAETQFSESERVEFEDILTKNLKLNEMKASIESYRAATVLFGSPKNEWRLLKSFEDSIGADSITLELFDLRGKPLLTKTFVLTQ